MKTVEKMTKRLREAREAAASIRDERRAAIERGDAAGIADADGDLRKGPGYACWIRHSLPKWFR